VVLNVIWAARALERIGDHSCNICDTLFIWSRARTCATTSLDQVEREILGKDRADRLPPLHLWFFR